MQVYKRSMAIVRNLRLCVVSLLNSHSFIVDKAECLLSVECISADSSAFWSCCPDL